ncbi:hypothetical protein ZIOFF_009977 [Zingiber officinale]|uniref:Uncharacterized protein n=1 Tax=Zingiber officinale TaxID=94328 RepID=A0A8J5HNV4_ZINOF|nr:hypothetical protein ZIOFF_009977 [Zingiber officinale]
MVQEMLYNAFGIHEGSTSNENYIGASTSHTPMESNVKDFYRLIEEGKQQLYTGCTEFSKLSFLVELFQLKVNGKWSDKSFTALLDFLRRVLPSEAQVPKSFYEAKKLISSLGLHYEKIHACPNDCMIYWGRNENEQACKVCNLPRWKNLQKSSRRSYKGGKKRLEVKIPAKVFWYFPLKPRLQRLFMSSKTSENMQWHFKKRVSDGNLRHPADSRAWKEFDERHYEFASDPRNVRLGLAANGFNPFKNQSTSHSRGVDHENESQDTTSHSPLELQNEEVNEQDENEIMSLSQTQKRKRGKTIMRDIHALHPDHMLVVKFNERRQPYGDLQPTLANYIRTIARNGVVLPLSFLDWRKMPTNRLNDAWKLVTARFCISNCHRRVIMQMMGATWRRWRTEMKATSYDSNTPLEELVAIQPIPHGLTLQTWEI